MDGIILAAGAGSRLGKITQGSGKALVRVAGKPLILYAIDFIRELGASRIFIVGGCGFDQLTRLIQGGDVELIRNDNFDNKGNLLSLKVALPLIRGSFVLANTDHIYKKNLVPVIQKQFLGITSFCDFDRQLGEDDMKVKFFDNSKSTVPHISKENLQLSKISKKLTDFDGGYVGMTYVNSANLEQYKLAVDDVYNSLGDTAVVENVLAYLADQDVAINIGDISGHGWLEIDTAEELLRAEQQIFENPTLFN